MDSEQTESTFFISLHYEYSCEGLFPLKAQAIKCSSIFKLTDKNSQSEVVQ